jgi:hypothetical protein
MKECALCGEEIDSQAEQEYSYDQFLHEMDKHEYLYCRECKEILRSSSAQNIRKEDLIKVDIHESDFPLPGFVYSIDKKIYIKPNKRKSRVMNIGR